jgi:hypothetical protein
MVGLATYATGSNFITRIGRQHDIHQFYVESCGKDTSRFVAKTRLAADVPVGCVSSQRVPIKLSVFPRPI